MYTKNELKCWDTDHLKMWWQELDDSYHELKPESQRLASGMMKDIQEIVKEREGESHKNMLTTCPICDIKQEEKEKLR